MKEPELIIKVRIEDFTFFKSTIDDYMKIARESQVFEPHLQDLCYFYLEGMKDKINTMLNQMKQEESDLCALNK